MESYLKRFLLVLGLGYIYSQESSTYKCDIYRCSQYTLNSLQCIYPHPLFANVTNSSKVYEISLTCPSGTYCPSYYNDNVTCTSVPSPSDRVDGEPCTNNTNCASNICNNGYCEGVANLGVCTITSQCKKGFYCGKLTNDSLVKNCVEQKSLNQACDTEYQCKNNMGCYSGNNTCQYYFSLPDGSVASLADSFLCKNSRVHNNICVSTELQGGEECLANNGTLQTQCVYKYSPGESNATMTSQCQCSRTYPNRQFCEYDTINPNWQKMINAVNEYFNHEAVNKHASRKMDFPYPLKRLVSQVLQYPVYKDSDECSINIEISSGYIKYSIYLLLSIIAFFAFFA
jgi:hypothetical protein